MPRPGSILSVYNSAISNINKLQHYYSLCQSLPTAIMRWFTGELIMLRLYGILERSFQDICTRVACGYPYRNGTIPSPSCHCRSIDDAINKFRTFGRPASTSLKFSNPHDINQAIRFVIPATDPFRNYLNTHASRIDEMRFVRNQIAHRTSSTYNRYRNVITSRFGAYFKIQPGPFLLSTKRTPIPILQEYFAWTRTIIDDLTRG